MIYTGKIVGGLLTIDNSDFSKIGDGDVIIEVTKKEITTTKQQNKAMHLWFSQLAEALNKDGYDMRVLIAEGIDIFWSQYTVKEHLWKPTQKAYLGKESTQKLTNKEINDIYDIINKTIGERTGIYIPFPSIEEKINENRIEIN